jgi:hypothetical protein
MGRANLKITLAVMALAATACAGQTSGGSPLKPRPVTVSPMSVEASNPSAPATRDPQLIVDELEAAGLALCHSDYSDAAQYNIFGFFGADATWRFFPHHSAVPVHVGNTDVLSCATADQPNTGVIEIDVYPSAVDASAALHQVGHIWLDGWLYGNVDVLVDQTTPPSVDQEVRDVLDQLPGTTQLP